MTPISEHLSHSHISSYEMQVLARINGVISEVLTVITVCSEILIVVTMSNKLLGLLVQSIQTSILMATGDALSQELMEKKGWKNYQARRTAEFAFLGCFLVGPALTGWYKILARHLGQKTNLSTTLLKVAADQLIFAPVFLGIFISCVGLLHGQNENQIRKTMEKKYWDILFSNWAVWPVVQGGNFYFVPLKYQVLVVQSVAVFWNTYLSWKTENDD
ncbi:hypothetical protein HUJ05_010146 [Dendroctonus ponderosae]|nr:hypothetical protein HUJ05_010146 [Dendroctonus ponderosae]